MVAFTCCVLGCVLIINIQVSDSARAGWKPNGAHSPGQAKRHPGFPHSRVSAPCKGKSINPLYCYSCLIADLAVLKWNTVCIFCSILAPCLKAFALTGRVFKIGFKKLTQILSKNTLNVLLINEIVFAFWYRFWSVRKRLISHIQHWLYFNDLQVQIRKKWVKFWCGFWTPYLTGRDCSNTRYPGCRFACPGLCATLGFQPALAESETSNSDFRRF